MHRFAVSDPANTQTRSSQVNVGRTDRINRYGRLTHGGLYNPTSGMGTRLDKAEQAYFQPTVFYSRAPLQILCVESWVARKTVNLPVEQMFLKWRTWQHREDESGEDFGKPLNEIMEEAEGNHRVAERLAMAMQAGRQYGSGFLLMVTREAPLTQPLRPERIRPGDLVSLIPLDRWDVSVRAWEQDLNSPDVLLPSLCDVHPTRGPGPFACHPSRLLRFDGMTEPTLSGFTYYAEQWGVSILVPVITAILQEAGLAQTIDHLTQEASVPVLHVEGLRDSLSGSYNVDLDEPTPEEIASQINIMKSNYRLLMLEKGNEEFNRVAVNFSGLADLMDRSARRASAAAGIPMTVMFSTSPIGLNATGEHDTLNWVREIEVKRTKMLARPLHTLDTVLARDAGLVAAPSYTWQSLLDIGDEAEADIANKRVDAVGKALNHNLIDEPEGRRILDGDAVFANLPGEPPALEFDVSADT